MAGYTDMNRIPREPSNIIVRLPTNIVSTPAPNAASTAAVKPIVVAPQQPPQVQQDNIIDLDFGEMTSAPPVSSPAITTTTAASNPIADLDDLFASVRIENRNHGNDEWPTNTGVSNASLFSNVPSTNDFTKSASFESFTKPSTDQFADFLSFSSSGVSSNNDKGINDSSKSTGSEKNNFGYLSSDLNNIGSVSTSTPMPMLSSNTIGFTSHSHSTGSDSELLRLSSSVSHNTNNFFPIPEFPQKNITFGLDSTNGSNNAQQDDSKKSSGFALDFGQFGLTPEVIPSQFPAFNQTNSLPVINASSKNGPPGDDKDFILSLYNN